MIKGASETIENKAKEQEGWILRMLSGILGGSLSRTLLSGKWVKSNRGGHREIRARDGVIRVFDGSVRAGQDF